MRGEDGRRKFLPLTVHVGSRVVEVPAILLPLLGVLVCLCWCLHTSAYEWFRGLDELTLEWLPVMFSDGFGWLAFLFVLLIVALVFVPFGLLALLAHTSKLPKLQPLWSFLASISARLEALLSSFAEGKLTLDDDGLSLTAGDVEKSMVWDEPIDVCRWGVRSSGGQDSPKCYEVWKLTQGQVEIILSRVVTPQRLSGLSLPPEERAASKKDMGLRVPKTHQYVFDITLWLGDVELRNAQDRLWRDST